MRPPPYYRLADERVEQILSLAESLLSNAEHVAAIKILDYQSREVGLDRPAVCDP